MHLKITPKYLIAIYILIFGIRPVALAQRKNVSKSNEQWIQYYAQVRLSEKWIWLTDGGYRWNDVFAEPSQCIVRTGIGMELGKSFRIAAGFAHLGFYRDGALHRGEYRPYQELQVKSKLSMVWITQRFRSEQRFFEHFNEQLSNFNFRFRYMLSFNIPVIMVLKAKSKWLELNVGDEIFFNAGKEIIYNVFDQNRILIGLAFNVRTNMELRLTYNSLFSAMNLPQTYRYSSIFWLGINHDLELSKK